MNWMHDIFGIKKPVIAMCHIPAMPGDPKFDSKEGMHNIIEKVLQDLNALQTGGADAVLFSNEFSMPYRTCADRITVAAMARIIGELHSKLKIPFGIDYMFDAKASVDLAAVTGACFIRGVVSGAYTSDFGVWNTDAGDTLRYVYQRRLENSIGLFYSVVPQGAEVLGNRDTEDILRSIQFHMSPDVICLPTKTAKKWIADGSIDNLIRWKKFSLVIDGGCNHSNISELLPKADGVIVGTAIKENGIFENAVDPLRVKHLMEIVEKSSNNI